jgi:hypothetical protein
MMHALTALLVVGSMASAFRSSADASGSASPTKPLVVLTGVDSRMSKTSFHRVESEQEFRKLWLAHLGKAEQDYWRTPTPAISVDFERCMVIAVFRVEKGNSRGLHVESVTDGDDQVTVRYTNLSYQTAAGFGRTLPPTPITPAYAFVVVPKSDKPVVLEEDGQRLKNDPPNWTERARLTK